MFSEAMMELGGNETLQSHTPRPAALDLSPNTSLEIRGDAFRNEKFCINDLATVPGAATAASSKQ